MRIGLDLRVLQDARRRPEHETVVRAACHELALRLTDSDRLVALIDPAAADPTGDLFPGDVHAEVVSYPEPRLRRLRKMLTAVSPEREAILDRHVDVLCQFDAGLGVPETVPTVLLVHDLASLRFGDRHPDLHRPSFRAARRFGMGPGTALYRALTRRLHERNLATALTRARTAITVSNHTASLLRGMAGAGVEILTAEPGPGPIAPTDDLNALEWNLVRGLELDDVPFLFHSGSSHDGARIADLVAAFNDLRARGRGLALVLTGDDVQTAETMIDRDAADAIPASSYRDDIHLLGTVRPELARWLGSHASVTVVPGEVAGSGSALLTAAILGSPVVATDHPSIAEHAGPGARLVPPRWEELSEAVDAVLALDPEQRGAVVEADRAWAAGRDWSEFADVLDASLRSRA